MGMRIVYILNNGGLLGANRSLLGTMEYMLKQGNKCFAIIPEKHGVEAKFEELGVEYAVIGYRPCVWYPGYIGLPFLVNIVRMPQVLRTIKKWNVNLIHSNNSSHDIGMIAALLLRKKHVWHIKEIMELSYQTKNIFPHFYRWLREKSDAVICVSDFVYRYQKDHYPNNHMFMVYNPYDVNYYDIKRTEFAPNEEITLLLAGGFSEYKRQMDSLKALVILKKRGIDNIKLILVGGGLPETVKEIHDYIVINQLENSVKVIDFQMDIQQLRRCADIALCCSENEALPRVVVEGMLGEMLIIGADSGGIAELLQHSENGLLYQPRDCENLADKIEYAINHKKECWKIIRRAKGYAIENFELNRSGERILSIYREILKKK